MKDGKALQQKQTANQWLGEYNSKYGKLLINKVEGKTLFFDLKTSGDGHSLCDFRNSEATIVNNVATLHQSECTVTLVNQGNSIKVTTKDCQDFCGFRSIGTIDGTYF